MAAFDLDGTLTEGGSVFAWLRAVAGNRVATEAAIKMAPRLGMAAIKGGSTADTTKEALFTEVLRGRDAAEVETISHEFAAKHVANELRTEVKARLDFHLASGHHVVIVSASPELYVSAVGELLGTNGAIGTKLAVDQQGKLTGRYELTDGTFLARARGFRSACSA